ncbi:MAG: fibronectin type III-like domain-contianing protein [Polyangiaceae bacterium]
MDATESATVTIDVTNSGSRGGDEIVQLYVRPRESDPKAPLQQLRGFARLHIEPGEAKTATFSIGAKELSHYDETAQAFRTDAGEYEIRVGASSTDIRETGTIRVTEGGIVDVGGGGGGAGGALGTSGASSGGATSDVSAPSKRKARRLWLRLQPAAREELVCEQLGESPRIHRALDDSCRASS